MELTLLLLPAILFIISNACTTDLDCELNGKCVNSICQCNKPWKGDYCQFLDRLPVNPSLQFYRGVPSNISSWGGNIIYDNSTKLYHLFYSEMINNCGLKVWEDGSYCAHATSTNLMTDPFKFKNVAITPQSHNCEGHRLGPKYNYQWLLLHQYPGNTSSNTVPTCCTNITTNGKDDYCNGTTPFSNVPNVTAPPPPNGYMSGSFLHTASSPDGPWTPVKLPKDGGVFLFRIFSDLSLIFFCFL